MTGIVWEGCLNVRDLGGLPTADGGTTRGGTVIRADNVRKLSDTGLQALVAHGVRRIVDLRWPEEIAGDPSRDMQVEVVHVSVLGARLDEEYFAELDAFLAANDAVEHYAFSYGDFLERYRDRFGLAFAAIAEVDGPVVVHCAGGKDRTGLVAAILLRLAGVPIETVAEDYALSDANLRPLNDPWIGKAASEAERSKREKLSLTPAEAMERVLRELDARYGDAAGYLRAAGLDDAQVASLRARLR